MSRPTRSPPLVLLLVAVLATAVPAVAAADTDTGEESASLAAIDRERAARGLPALRRAADLVDVARRHSQRMADGNSLHHDPSLGSEVSGWRSLGENVGRGPDAGAVHRSFMASPSHRDNILSATFLEVGVGVERRGDVVWVTQVFRTPAQEPASAEPSPTPAASPTSTPTAAPTEAGVTTASASGVRPAAAPAPDRLVTMLAAIDEHP